MKKKKINEKKIIFSKFGQSKFITCKFDQNVYVYHFKGSSVSFLKNFGFCK